MPLRKYPEPCGCNTNVDRDGAYIDWCSTHVAAEEMRDLLQELVEEENAHGVLYGKDMVHFTLMDRIRSVLKKQNEQTDPA